MSFIDYIINFTLAVVLIVGGYQLYFLPQRNKFITAREFSRCIEDNIPFRVRWVWVYSGLYYPMILLLVFTVDSFKSFNYIAFSFFVLLLLHLIFFFFFPIQTPDVWRSYNKNESLSHRFLAVVHSYDQATNCFPSTHVSIAVLTSLHLYNQFAAVNPEMALLVFFFPFFIALSTLYTKQHYFIDVPAGTLLGYIVFDLFNTSVTRL